MYISITVSPKSQHKRPVSTASTRTQCTKTVTYTLSMIVAFPSCENRPFHTSAYTRRNIVLPARELHCAQVAWCSELIRRVIRVEFGWLLARVVRQAMTWFVFVSYWRDGTEPRNTVGETINIHKPSPNFTINRWYKLFLNGWLIIVLPCFTPNYKRWFLALFSSQKACGRSSKLSRLVPSGAKVSGETRHTWDMNFKVRWTAALDGHSGMSYDFLNHVK